MTQSLIPIYVSTFLLEEVEALEIRIPVYLSISICLFTLRVPLVNDLSSYVPVVWVTLHVVPSPVSSTTTLDIFCTDGNQIVVK